MIKYYLSLFILIETVGWTIRRLKSTEDIIVLIPAVMLGTVYRVVALYAVHLIK